MHPGRSTVGGLRMWTADMDARRVERLTGGMRGRRWAVGVVAALAVAGGTVGEPAVEGPAARTVSVELARSVDVATVTMSNGVRARVMRLPSGVSGGRVWITLRVLGEPREVWGEGGGQAQSLAWRAAMAWEAPAGVGRPAHTLGPDGLQLRFQGSTEEAGAALRSMAEMLTRPRVDAERLTALRSPADMARAAGPEMERWATQVQRFMGGPAGVARDEAAGVESVAAWLKAAVHRGPIEVAVVGDVDVATVEPLLRRELGVVTPRAVASPALVAVRRGGGGGGGVAEREAARAEVRGPRSADGAVWVRGPGPEIGDLAGVRTWAVASAALKDALGQWQSEQGWEAASGSRRATVWVTVVPGRVTMEAGRVVVSSMISGTDEQVRGRAAEFEARLWAVAREGLGAEAVMAAAERAAGEAERKLRDASYWADVLPMAGLYGLDVDALAAAPGAYRAMTAERVNAALRAWAEACVPAKGEGSARLLVQLPAEVRAVQPAAEEGRARP